MKIGMQLLYKEVKKAWVVELGVYNIKVGNPSREIQQETQINIK